MNSTFFTPAGQRRLQVLHVVQAHNSGLLNKEGSGVKAVCRTNLRIFKGDLNLTGQPPVHVPH
jgi:hypothetical protein